MVKQILDLGTLSLYNKIAPKSYYRGRSVSSVILISIHSFSLQAKRSLIPSELLQRTKVKSSFCLLKKSFLVAFSAALYSRITSPSSGMIHPYKQEIEQRWQEACTDEQGASAEACMRWKPGQMTEEEYRKAFWLCRDVVRESKAHLELNLVRDVNGNKEVFYRYNSKRKLRKL